MEKKLVFDIGDKPKFGQMFWANHTPNTRKLTCTCCGHKGFCVETYKKETK